MRPNQTDETRPRLRRAPPGGFKPLRAFGKWMLAATLAGAIGAAIAAPAAKEAVKDKPKGPATATQQVKKEDGFQTAAPTAILIDGESGSVLFEKNADMLVPPASLSKLMTTEVVLNEIKQGRLKPTDEFIVSENAWRRAGRPRTRRACSPRSIAGSRWTTCCMASSSSRATTPASCSPKVSPAARRNSPR